MYVQKRDRPGHGFRAAAQVISYVSIAVPKRTNYGDFIKTLLADDLKAMNKDMNDVTLTTFSYFDRGGSLQNLNRNAFTLWKRSLISSESEVFLYFLQ